MGVAKDNLNKFRREDVKNNKTKNLDKRTELIIQQVKPKTDFKAKIESLLEEKLNIPFELKNSEQELKITHDLGEIFRKNNEGRTEDVHLQR